MKEPKKSLRLLPEDFVQEHGVKPLPTIQQMAGWPGKMPTLRELLDQGDEHPWMKMVPAPVPRVEQGLFHSMLGGNLTALLDDLMRDPERYTEQERALLQELASGGKDLKALSAEEARLLNQITLSFASFRPPKTPPTAPKPPPVKEPTLVAEATKEDDGLDIDDLPPFWWL